MRILLLSLLPATSLAAWPEDVTLSGMTEHQGIRVTNSAVLTEAYDELVVQLATVVANKPVSPADTLGAFGFDFSFGNTFVFVPNSTSDGSPTPWQRAHADEDPNTYQFVPSFTARKGLPFSLELGGTAGWVGMSRQGIFGGFLRLALVEGYKPAPDITLQAGYSGYVGNPELELGVIDFGVTLGSTYAFGSLPGIRQAQFSPYLNFTTLLVQAAPVVSESVGAALFGAEAADRVNQRKTYGPLFQFAGGFQITNSTFLMRLIGTWSPQSVASAHIGMGFTF